MGRLLQNGGWNLKDYDNGGWTTAIETNDIVKRVASSSLPKDTALLQLKSTKLPVSCFKCCNRIVWDEMLQ